jgi:hypothetical protein
MIVPISMPRLILVGCLTWACAAGCGQVNSVPVEGTVTLKGKPLPNATVMLTSTRGSGPGPYVGKTDTTGRFVLGPSDKSGNGAAAGEYSVIIATITSDPNDAAPVQASKEIVPNRFRLGSEKFTVPDGGTKEVLFAM